MRLMKAFYLGTRQRKLLNFSDKTKIRLNDDDKLDTFVALKPTAGKYPTDVDITFTSWKINIQKLVKWLAFDANIEEPSNTAVHFRLSAEDSSQELFWDGGAWVIAGVNQWNTLEEVSSNLRYYVPTDTNLAIKVRLLSTDGISTPKIRWLKIAYELELVPWSDLIYDTVIAEMRNSIRATTVIEIAVATSSSLIDLANLQTTQDYNFTEVKSVHNLSIDPKALNNIADSYNPGAMREDGTYAAGQVNLSASVNSGQVVRLVMEYEPEIAVQTGQDYYEVAKFPAIVFEQINASRSGDGQGQELNDGESDFVRDIQAGTAIEVPRPRQSSVMFQYAVHGNPADYTRLADAVDKWVGSVRSIQTYANDDMVSLDPVTELQTNKESSLDDLVSAVGAFRLKGVPFYIRDANDVNLIENVNITMIDS